MTSTQFKNSRNKAKNALKDQKTNDQDDVQNLDDHPHDVKIDFENPPQNSQKPEESDDEEGPTPCWKWVVRALIAFIVIGGTIFVIVRRDITRAVLEWFFTWLGENRWIGPIALFFIFAIA